jgi:hypothetical protein
MNDLVRMFNDGRFLHYGGHRYFAEINGRKIGVALAVRDKGGKRHVLMKDDLDQLTKAEPDAAYVVAVMIDHMGNAFYDDQINAEKLDSKALGSLTLRVCEGKGYELEPWVIGGRRRKPFVLPQTLVQSPSF